MNPAREILFVAFFLLLRGHLPASAQSDGLDGVLERVWRVRTGPSTADAKRIRTSTEARSVRFIGAALESPFAATRLAAVRWVFARTDPFLAARLRDAFRREPDPHVLGKMLEALSAFRARPGPVEVGAVLAACERTAPEFGDGALYLLARRRAANLIWKNPTPDGVLTLDPEWAGSRLLVALNETGAPARTLRFVAEGKTYGEVAVPRPNTVFRALGVAAVVGIELVPPIPKILTVTAAPDGDGEVEPHGWGVVPEGVGDWQRWERFVRMGSEPDERDSWTDRMTGRTVVEEATEMCFELSSPAGWRRFHLEHWSSAASTWRASLNGVSLGVFKSRRAPRFARGAVARLPLRGGRNVVRLERVAGEGVLHVLGLRLYR